MNRREVIRRLQQNGWIEVAQSGSHKQFKHPAKPGRVTVVYPQKMFLKELSGASRNNLASGSGKGGTMEYIAYLHKDKNSDYGVSFPDFPGCVTAGSTLEEARAMAAEALALHVAGMREDGEEIPEPSTLDDLRADPAMKGAVAFLAELREPERTVRINITARQSQIAEIDRRARARGLTRSSYIVQCALQRKVAAR